jgi:hypothetical protein
MEGAWPGHDAVGRNNRRDAMKKAETKNAGKQEKVVKESKAKNGKAKPAVRELPSERLGVPPTTPDVDLKVKAAEAAHSAPTVAAKAAKPTKDATAKTGGDTGERGATGTKPMSLMDAAVNILSQGTGDPMRCKDIVDLAAQRGLWTPRTGKTPASTLYAAILREITLKGEASRFVKTERGKFALKDSQYAREATKGQKT